MFNQVHTLFNKPLRIGCLGFSGDGRTLATTGGYRGNSIRLWNCDDWALQGTLKGHKQEISSLAFVGNTSILISGGLDKIVNHWDCQELGQIASHNHHSKWVRAIACNADGTFAASGGQDGQVLLWPIDHPDDPYLFAEVKGEVNSLAFSPRDQIVVTAGGVERQVSEIIIWDIQTRKPIRRLTNHSDWVLWVGFSRDGGLLASGSYGEILLWDTSSWKLLQILKRPKAEKFSTIGFAFSGNSNAFISGAWSHEYKLEEVLDVAGNVIGWNQRSKGLLQTWNLSTGKLTECFEAHAGALQSFAFCPETSLLATGGADGALKIWSVDPL